MLAEFTSVDSVFGVRLDCLNRITVTPIQKISIFYISWFRQLQIFFFFANAKRPQTIFIGKKGAYIKRLRISQKLRPAYFGQIFNGLNNISLFILYFNNSFTLNLLSEPSFETMWKFMVYKFLKVVEHIIYVWINNVNFINSLNLTCIKFLHIYLVCSILFFPFKYSALKPGPLF